MYTFFICRTAPKRIMWKVVRIPAGNITNLHYNFVVAKPLVFNTLKKNFEGSTLVISMNSQGLMRFEHPENKRVLTLRIAQNQICGR